MLTDFKHMMFAADSFCFSLQRCYSITTSLCHNNGTRAF